MATISILANTVRPDPRSDDTAFEAGTFSWQDPVHSWKAGPGEVMTVENLFILNQENLKKIKHLDLRAKQLNSQSSPLLLQFLSLIFWLIAGVHYVLYCICYLLPGGNAYTVC